MTTPSRFTLRSGASFAIDTLTHGALKSCRIAAATDSAHVPATEMLVAKQLLDVSRCSRNRWCLPIAAGATLWGG
jgi:hypothetical protein